MLGTLAKIAIGVVALPVVAVCEAVSATIDYFTPPSHLKKHLDNLKEIEKKIEASQTLDELQIYKKELTLEYTEITKLSFDKQDIVIDSIDLEKFAKNIRVKIARREEELKPFLEKTYELFGYKKTKQSVLINELKKHLDNLKEIEKKIEASQTLDELQIYKKELISKYIEISKLVINENEIKIDDINLVDFAKNIRDKIPKKENELKALSEKLKKEKEEQKARELKLKEDRAICQKSLDKLNLIYQEAQATSDLAKLQDCKQRIRSEYLEIIHSAINRNIETKFDDINFLKISENLLKQVTQKENELNAFSEKIKKEEQENLKKHLENLDSLKQMIDLCQNLDELEICKVELRLEKSDDFYQNLKPNKIDLKKYIKNLEAEISKKEKNLKLPKIHHTTQVKPVEKDKKKPVEMQISTKLKSLGIKYLYHMTSVDNLAGILKHGLQNHHTNHKKIDISNKEVNSRRTKKNMSMVVPSTTMCHFIFNPKNAMMFRCQREYRSKLILLGFSTEICDNKRFVFSNRNASANLVQFTKNIDRLFDKNWIDFSIVFSSCWVSDGFRSDYVKQIMMAETLIDGVVEVQNLKAIFLQDYGQLHIFDFQNLKDIEIFVDESKFFKGVK